MSEWIWIPLGIASVMWSFSLLACWSEMGPIAADDTEDP